MRCGAESVLYVFATAMPKAAAYTYGRSGGKTVPTVPNVRLGQHQIRNNHTQKLPLALIAVGYGKQYLRDFSAIDGSRWQD